MPVRRIDDVVRHGLCSGCGACSYASPDKYQMTDVQGSGRRPVGVGGVTMDRDDDALRVCPGVGLAHETAAPPAMISFLSAAWGPVMAVFEGHAGDEAIRYAGSSGGAASALALYCLEQGGMAGVLHTAARADAPHLNETVMSTTREELLGRTGSRYAPASPCEGLQRIEEAERPCVFIGKPCDVAGAQKARRLRPGLDRNLGLTIGFFCAGTPSTSGTLAMLRRMGIEDPSSLVSLRYRGNGWPGKATAVFRGPAGYETRELTYEESWGEVLTKHQQWRCKVCADHTGEFADVAVGDPWYRPIDADNPGSSLILARTTKGLRVLEAAAAAGYLTLVRADPEILPRSQANLLRTRGAVWGRILASRLAGAAAPRYRNMPMFRHWWRQLSFGEKVRSIVGTWKRLLRRRIMYGYGAE